MFDEVKAMKQGLVPAAPLARIIERWAKQYDIRHHTKNNFEVDLALHPDALLAERTGLNQDTIYKVRTGRKDWILFDNADKILIAMDEDWNSNEELSRIYDEFDFSNLDLCSPPSPEANELLLLEGLSDRAAAAALGVCQTTANRLRQRLKRERLEQLGEVLAA